MCYKHIISKLCYLKINIDWLVQTYQLVIEKYRIWVINISSIVLSFFIRNKIKIKFYFLRKIIFRLSLPMQCIKKLNLLDSKIFMIDIIFGLKTMFIKKWFHSWRFNLLQWDVSPPVTLVWAPRKYFMFLEKRFKVQHFDLCLQTICEGNGN